MYNGKAESEEELAGWALRGHAWSCEGCFMRSTFSVMILDRQDEVLRRRPHPEFPDVPWDDTIKCVKCHDWLPANFFTCYGNWWRLRGREEDSELGQEPVNMDSLQSFMRQRCLVWGCNGCFADSQLCVYRDDRTGKWTSRYRPPGSKVYRERARNKAGRRKKIGKRVLKT